MLPTASHSLTSKESLHSLFVKRFASNIFTSARKSLRITLLENRLSELENHGAKLCQTNLKYRLSRIGRCVTL
jgi:hypothetical protein